jgi:hypothetical protein
VKVTLPAHLNVDALRGYEAELAGALHLPKGGGVSFSAGGPDHPRNVVFIAVTRKNMMSGAIPYPKLTPTTINKPVGFGRRQRRRSRPQPQRRRRHRDRRAGLRQRPP